MRYKLLNKWEFEGTLIKVYFEVDKYPTSAGELIFHRYEGVTSHSRAKYKYFVVDGYGGAILKSLPNYKIFANHPLSIHNKIDKPSIILGESPNEIYLTKE